MKNNLLNGFLSKSLGSLVDLRVLILSHNNFTGQVPDLSSLTVNDVNEVKVKSQNPISFCKNQALAVGVIPRPHMHVYGKKMVKKPPPRVIAENGTGSYTSKLLSDARVYLKPNEPYTLHYHDDVVPKRLRVTQERATHKYPWKLSSYLFTRDFKTSCSNKLQKWRLFFTDLRSEHGTRITE
ncbi:probable inactive leucine-rich repeat receptor-like protein kinase [Tanacetum coccineum]